MSSTPVRQWVLIWVMRLPIPLRLLLAAQPKLVTPVLQVVHRVITQHLLSQALHKPDEADSGAVTLIQRFGSAANLNIHLYCLVLDGVHWRNADGTPAFVEASAPSDEALQTVLHNIITGLTLLTRRGMLVGEEGSTRRVRGELRAPPPGAAELGPAGGQSSVMPLLRMIGPQRLDSARAKARNCSGVPGIGSMPKSRNRFNTTLLAKALLSSAFRRCSVAAGRPAGPSSP